MKRCIYHLPNFIDHNRKSGSHIRPLKMLNAFKNNGYEVDFISGYGKERKESIARIKNNIKQGIKYDFLYSESSTMPTLLTEKNHIPKYPFLDFSFFKFCKKNNIKIGLFYRDMYWKFDDYKKDVSILKRMISVPMYKYDLHMYKKYVDILYLPSIEMGEYLPKSFDRKKIKALPPGIDKNKIKEFKKHKGFNIFYVGGVSKIGSLYDLSKLMSIVNIDKNISVTVCCRKDDWYKVKDDYKPFLNKQISIVHKSGEELDEYFYNADLCSLIFPYDLYRSFAIPIKLFDYLSYGVPIISTDRNVAATFIKKNDLGVVVKYDDDDIRKCILSLMKDGNILQRKRESIKKSITNEKWEDRALTVERDLNR